MNKIVILGCGYIGTNVANFLVSKKENEIFVIGIENYYTDKLDKRVKYISLKTEEIDEKQKTIFKQAIVIDATGNTNATSPSEIAGVTCLENCMNKVKLVHILYGLKIKKYIFLSSGGTIYGDSKRKHRENERNNPLNIYALEKVILEEFLKINYIENQTFNYLILRLSNPYGGIISPNKRQGIIDVAIQKVLKEEVLDFYGNTNNVRDYIYIDDLSEAIYQFAVSEKANDVYNIGTGVGYSIKEVFKQIEKTYQKKVQLKCYPIKTINIKTNVLNINKMKKDIGFCPTIGLKRGIEKIKKERN